MFLDDMYIKDFMYVYCGKNCIMLSMYVVHCYTILFGTLTKIPYTLLLTILHVHYFMRSSTIHTVIL